MIKVRLADIALKVSSGLTPNRSNKEFWQNGMIDWVKTEQIGERYIFSSTEKISLEALEKTSIKLNPINTISIAMYGEGKTRGSVSILKNEMTTNQACCNIIVNEKKADVDFIYYKLKTQYDNLRALSSGIRKNLNSNDIKEFEITIPNLTIQQKIASVLSALDDKIELNNKINAELEAMAKTLYDYWFVQFDFPDANGRLYKSSGGKMVYDVTLKREIPEGWEVRTLASFINSDKSGDWGKEEKQGNYTVKVECIRGADINGINGKGDVKAPIRYILEKNTHKILSANDFVVEISGGSPVQSTGRITCITEEVLKRFQNPLICSNFCKAVSLKNEIEVMYFLSAWNKAYDNNVLFGFEGKTSGIKNLLFEDFTTAYSIVKPASKVIRDFNNKLSLFERKRQQNLKQNQELAQLRDWLLPMLMNGQVTVGEAEGKIGMVAEEGVDYKN